MTLLFMVTRKENVSRMMSQLKTSRPLFEVSTFAKLPTTTNIQYLIIELNVGVSS